jgi:thiol-disulfide isomerase/thioredoxin
MKYAIIFAFTVIAVSCIEAPNQYSELPPGQWRAVMKLSDDMKLGNESALVEADKNLLNYFELPFNMEVTSENGELNVFLLNGSERMKADEVFYGRDPSTAKDTVKIGFSGFDTYLDAYYEENFIEGFWKVPYRGKDYSIPFLATYGESHRFDMPASEENYNFSGQWKAIFSYGSENAYPAIAEFSQNGQKLLGTIMTETGDYRYLQGNVSGDKMKLSVFDGAHAFLFSAKVTEDTITGEFKSGSHYTTNWIAFRDESFELKNPYELSKKLSEKAIEFEFENLDGGTTKLSDPSFEGKIKLINIMGTWCPNCYDEIEFLKNFKEENPDVVILSVAYEKYKDTDKAKNVLRNYKTKRGIDWPLLYGGYADKEETGRDFPFIDKIYSYPSLLIIDGENKLAGIQTGFYGPATSKHESFKNEFYAILGTL